MSTDREFDDLRLEPDPFIQGRLATEKIEKFSQYIAELSRIRRHAVERARAQTGAQDKDIADKMTLSKSRLSQLMKTAPTVERIFFGHGPVKVGVPYRYQTTDRERPLIAAEDTEAPDSLVELLRGMSFLTKRFQIEPDRENLPDGDVVVVCGPKSAPVGAALLREDPALDMVEHDDRWWIVETATGTRHGSPADESPPGHGDIAYVARHIRDGRIAVHIAGIHTVGSLGAAHYLAANLPSLFAGIGDTSCSLIVGCTVSGREIAGSTLVAGPFVW
ncbi:MULTISPECIES: hypothetical protein [Amycolatopsis]|uniref:Uncharacterized protein n=1 Tax=Amycolatopsis albidoflavus TaxID=102226 RepID=A0ABW5HXP5_9PSEU